MAAHPPLNVLVPEYLAAQRQDLRPLVHELPSLLEESAAPAMQLLHAADERRCFRELTTHGPGSVGRKRPGQLLWR